MIATKPTHSTDASTLVYVWRDGTYTNPSGFFPAPAARVKCHTCDATGYENFDWHDHPDPEDFPFLVCAECGEQFYQTRE